MATKFYFHAAPTTDTGTLPAAGVSLGSSTPTKIASGGDTNRSMDTVIGAAQTSQAVTTNAVVTSQSALLARFCSAPIGAQTFSNSTLTLTLGAAISESSTNSSFFCWFSLFVWRPGSGSTVGTIYEGGPAGSPGLTATASEAWSSASPGMVTETTVSSLNNDILVVEIWRQNTVQSMASALTNSFFYDGTTEASATNAASFLTFSDTVTFASVTPVPLPFPHQSVPFYPRASRPS